LSQVVYPEIVNTYRVSLIEQLFWGDSDALCSKRRSNQSRQISGCGLLLYEKAGHVTQEAGLLEDSTTKLLCQQSSTCLFTTHTTRDLKIVMNELHGRLSLVRDVSRRLRAEETGHDRDIGGRTPCAPSGLLSSTTHAESKEED
jgi:hypothetical protein